MKRAQEIHLGQQENLEIAATGGPSPINTPASTVPIRVLVGRLISFLSITYGAVTGELKPLVAS
jgi:hypothetical protein